MNTILKRNTVFSDFMSNIGGLFGLWFGISFVDMTQVFIRLSINIKIFFLSHIDLNLILSVLSRFKFVIIIIHWMKKLKIYVDYIDKVNWQIVLQVLTLPIIIYQIWDLTDDYLKYPMDVSVEWFPYKDSNYRLSDESIPAITVCYEHIFKRILFDKIIQDSFFHNFNHSIDIKFDSIEEKIQTTDPYIRNLIIIYYNIMFHKLKDSYESELKESEMKKLLKDSLLYYLDVNNKTEFIERQFRLNDKTFNDFNGIRIQLDF